jgi:hypothetical protein
MARVRPSSLWIAVAAVVGCVALGVSVPFVGPMTLAVLAAVGLFALAVARPDIVVIGLIVWLPIEGWVLKFVPGGSIALLASDGVAVALTVGILLSAAMRSPSTDERRGMLRILAPGGLLLVAALLSWLLNGASAVDAAYWIRVYLRFVPLGVVAVLEPWRSNLRRWLPPTIMGVLAFQCAVGLLQATNVAGATAFFWPGRFTIGAVSTQADTLALLGQRVVAGTTSHPNILGEMLVLCVALLMGRGVSGEETRRGWKIANWALATLGVWVILLTQSRQAVACMAVFGAFLLGYVWLRGSVKLRMGSAMLPVGAAALGAIGLFQGVTPLLQRLQLLTQDTFWTVELSKNRGYALETVAARIAQRSPFFGVGPGSFGSSFGSSTGQSGASMLALDPVAARYVGDVGWVAVFAQVGVVGVSALLLMTWGALRGVRSPSVVAKVVSVSIVAMLVIGMLASTPLIYKPVSSLMWLYLGLYSVWLPSSEGVAE